MRQKVQARGTERQTSASMNALAWQAVPWFLFSEMQAWSIHTWIATGFHRTGLVLSTHIDVIPRQVLIGINDVANAAPHRIYPEQIPLSGAG
jgi:hypothetical protein